MMKKPKSPDSKCFPSPHVRFFLLRSVMLDQMTIHWSINADHPVMEARGEEVTLIYVHMGDPLTTFPVCPFQRPLSPTAAKQTHCCSLTRNFIDAAQWLSECLSIHGTATQSRFTLGIKHRLRSPSLYRVVQGHCHLNSRRGLFNLFVFCFEMKH